MRTWLPYADWVPGVPDGIEAEVYDGSGDPPRSIAEVEVYVLPYMQGPGPLRLIEAMASLRVVQTLTAGVDDVVPFVPDGVTLCNARGVHDASTAELAVALVLASLRGLPEFVRAADRGSWVPERRESLADKSVLLVGYGAVGSAVERRLAGFECEVRRVARRARDGVHGFDELHRLLPGADVVVLTVPLTEQTRGLVDASFLAAMRDGALLVNVARGPVVRTDALMAELGTGRLRAALDVTDPEPLPAAHPLWASPGLLVSPHVGGNSSAFLPRARTLVLDQLERLAAGRPPRNVVPAEGETGGADEAGPL